jgi:uncharacterized membrane protein
MQPSSPDLLQFIGHFHPVLVHLPIGMFMALVALEAAARLPRWKHLTEGSRPLLWLAALTGIPAALCGWCLASDGGYDATLLDRHRWTGTAAALGLTVLLTLHLRGYQRTYLAGLASMFALMTAAGHFGGDLTHGRGFLTRHAPEALRRLLGPAEAPEAAPSALARQRDPLALPVYETFVQPILASYCASCHGPEKVKGGLRVDSLEALTKGGESGPALVPARPADSPLLTRIELPLSHDEHMPPEGKPQPTTNELALLSWWIDAGAPPGRSAHQLQAPETIQKILADRRIAPTRPRAQAATNASPSPASPPATTPQATPAR